jgi:hypothetical protein
MQLHTLKTWPDQFTALTDGSKTFEVRYDDRGFAVGDLLRLAEWDPDTSRFTDRMLLRRVTHLHRGFGLADGYVVLGLTDVEEEL